MNYWEVHWRMFPALEISPLFSSQVYNVFICKFWHDAISDGKMDTKGPLKHMKDPSVDIKGTCSTKVRLCWKRYTLCLESITESCLLLDVGRDVEFINTICAQESRIKSWAPKVKGSRNQNGDIFPHCARASVPGQGTPWVGELAYFNQIVPPCYLCLETGSCLEELVWAVPREKLFLLPGHCPSSPESF